MTTTKKKTVLHSVATFLNESENWIYPQVANLVCFRAMVICDHIKNADIFRFPKDKIRTVSPVPRYVSKRVARRIPLFDRAWKFIARVALIRKIEPCIMHSHFGPRGCEDMSVATFLRVPQVVSFYGEDLFRRPLRERWLRRYRKLFDCAKAFIVEGPHMAAELKSLGCPEKKIRIRPHGVDLAQFPFGPCASLDNKLRVLVAGRFVEKKGIPFAVEAVLRVMHDLPEVELTIVGGATQSESKGQAIAGSVEGLIYKSGLQDRVTWHQFLPLSTLLDLAKNHDLFVQASVHASDGDCEGGSPVILNQLAALGMPFVATEHCDIPQIVRDGVNGIVVPERDITAMSNAIRMVLSDATMRRRFATESRRLIEREFSQGKAIEILESIYQEAIAAP